MNMNSILKSLCLKLKRKTLASVVIWTRIMGAKCKLHMQMHYTYLTEVEIELKIHTELYFILWCVKI